ncbi:ABC transporter ATP-binding protein [Geomicrobium sp. JCM 19039]|uniref:ABC transporter ATP-binding protein n=1 Tax=Geomicrobium sp. JCM 19039 TaxID=1460636 RepID=UPI00045F1AFD|nr:ABC transporter ATP-binding protein [Geomicrobium sp. JCM 19039]GAK13732.1 multiple sugar ABC transporter, ATP-binding protein [Geomicrobium sp. JCM 19039]
MAKITFHNITKKFGDETVIPTMNMEIKDGSFTVLVGPSGCGKSTTLRMIAGLEKQSSGDIFIGDRCVNDISAGKRDVAMVFQNYALYPTMTVWGNIEFGLKNRKIPKYERKQLIEEITEIVGLTPYLHKKPQKLSGGQRQRVALARAMVKKPEVFILDEPLSNLDAKLRHQMRAELVQLHQRLGTTFVYVTHDQVEAMSMADEIVLLDKGEVQQIAAPLTMYDYPKNLFTAQFIGTPPMNIIDTTMLPAATWKKSIPTKIGFRPEKIMLAAQPSRLHFSLPCTVLARETLGTEIIYQLDTFAGTLFAKTFQQPIINSKNLYLTVKEEDIYSFKKNNSCIAPPKGVEREIKGIVQ